MTKFQAIEFSRFVTDSTLMNSAMVEKKRKCRKRNDLDCMQNLLAVKHTHIYKYIYVHDVPCILNHVYRKIYIHLDAAIFYVCK